MKRPLLIVIALMTSILATSQVKLHPDFSADNSIEYYEISPDGSRVVYIADIDTDNVFELYSTPIAGGTSTKLSGTMVTDGDVSFGAGKRFQFSPDGQTVVYLADQEINGTPELFAVPIGGGSVTKLNGTLVGSDGVRGFQISPDGQTVVYVADELDNFDDELYSVSINGGTSTKISQADIGIGDVYSTFQISGDGQWVVYVANADDSSDDEIYSVPIEGGTINKLNGTLVSGGDVLSNKFYISSDSQYVVYVADQDTNFVDEVYSTPIAGGTSVKLNEDLPTTSDDVDRVFLSPNGQWVVYVAGNFANQNYEIFSVPTAGGTANNIGAPTMDFDGDGSLRNSVLINAASDLVFYNTNTTNFTNLIPETFAVLIDGSEEPLNISGLSSTNNRSSSNSTVGVQGTRIEEQEDGSCMMIMEVDAGPPGVIEIWRRKINKGSNRSNSIITLGELIRVNSDLVSGGDVTHTLVSPDGQNVIYRADQQENNVFELFTTPLEGGGPTYKINGQLVTNGDVSFDRTTNNASSFQGVQISSDGSRVIYLADQDTDGVFELYGADYMNILSIDDLANENNMFIFNDDQGNIHIHGIDQGKATLEVYSILGQRVFNTSFEANGNNTISTYNISQGLYIVKVINENRQSTSKKMIFR